MSASVVAFLRPGRRPQDWSAQELAEFYRVEAALIRVGLSVEVDRGLTDEGDPWFVFCRADDGEVVVHFARIDGMYFVGSPAYGGVTQGRDFNALVRALIERHPIAGARNEEKSNVIFHPAALLVVLVATAIFKTSAAHAIAPSHDTVPNSAARHATHSGIIATMPSPITDMMVSIDAQCSGIILSAIVVALASDLTSESLVTPPHTSPTPDSDALSRPWAYNHLFDLGARGDILDPQLPVHDAGSSSPGLLQGKVALSLMAILWDLPGTNAQLPNSAESDHVPWEPGGSDHILSPLSSVVPIVAPVPEAPVVIASAQFPPSLFIELHSVAGALPDVLAAYVLLDSGAVVSLTQDSIVYLPTLPAMLASALQSGVHIPVDATSHSVPDQIGYVVSPDTQATLSGGIVEAQNSSHALATTVSSETSSPAAAFSVQAHIVLDSTPQQVPVDPQMLLMVETAVKEFTAEVNQASFIITDHSVIIYDATAVVQHIPSLTSMTFDFADGSTISLVGLPGEIAHAIGH